MKQLAPLALVLLLAACGRSDSAPGAVTPGEEKALNEAAEMIEGQRLNPSAVPPIAPAPAVQVAEKAGASASANASGPAN